MAQVLAMLRFACGIFLTTFAIAAMVTGEACDGWRDAVVAGIIGIGFFASALLTRLAWLRWVAIAWWLGQLARFAVPRRVEALPLSAALLLLAGPGYVLMSRRAGRAGA